MARIKGGMNAKKKHNRVLKLAKGYRGARSKQYRVAKQSVMRALTAVSYTHLNIEAGDDAELSAKLSVSSDCKNLNEYLEKFEFPLQLLQTREAVKYSEMCIRDRFAAYRNNS